MGKQIKAFIFDLDGVITDTAEYHYLAWKQLAEDMGISFDRDFNEQLKGVRRMDSLKHILTLNPKLSFSKEELEALATRKNEHYITLIKDMTPNDILPGIRKLIEEIKKHELQLALGSASKNARIVLERLQLLNSFDYIVDAAKVEHGKPHPETFLTGAEGLGVSPLNCVGVEDAKAGVDAIKAAGMFAVGIGSKEHLAKADYIVETTRELQFVNIMAEVTK
ncbi:beta-phosphoglucomutase [Evansella caseinilytica]|uniref:Beta-phosphoglucomutase n=1 Tax=Evansella caseinilytica TaxID=1503961 RepID=A0A1H3UKM1_9BACI|nr:beta-phosphoglucomutase [Evansella caseinilytica]SDZ62866.1 beta-phosphoglucomutase [Evansella caseinilytica]